jgi:hypothetical protein
MFNRHIELSFVKNRKPETDAKEKTEKKNYIEDSKEAIKELTKYIFVGSIVVIVTTAAINTLGIIAVEAFKSTKV